MNVKLILGRKLKMLVNSSSRRRGVSATDIDRYRGCTLPGIRWFLELHKFEYEWTKQATTKRQGVLCRTAVVQILKCRLLCLVLSSSILVSHLLSSSSSMIRPEGIVFSKAAEVPTYILFFFALCCCWMVAEGGGDGEVTLYVCHQICFAAKGICCSGRQRSK